MSDVNLSLFDPSGSLFASIVPSLSTHKIQIQSVLGANDLNINFNLEKNSLVTCLKWGYLTSSQSLQDIVLLIGTSDSKIIIYSPFSNQVVDTLINDSPVLDLHYDLDSNSIWLIDSRNYIVEWSLLTFKKVKTLTNLINNDDEIFKMISSIVINHEKHLVLTSHKVYIYNLNKNIIIKEISNHINTINQLLIVDDQKYLITSSINDRFINIYDISLDFKSIKILVTENDITKIDCQSLADKGLLSVITENGILEVFENPLLSTFLSKSDGPADNIATINTTNKRRRKKASNSTSSNSLIQNSTSQIKLIRRQSQKTTDSLDRAINGTISILNAFYQNNYLIISWFENATIPFFDKIHVFNGNNKYMLIHGINTTEIPFPMNIQATAANMGSDIAATGTYNETNVYLNTGDNFNDLDMDEDDHQIEIDEDEDDETFGEKLSMMDPKSKKNDTKNRKQTTGSLTVILTQALKSNDHALLEFVLQNKDEKVIQSTIKSMNSQYCVLLLDKLSERYNFSTRATSSGGISFQKQLQLNYWIKWVLIIHGSYLNSKNSNKQLLKNLSFLLLNLNKKSKQLNKMIQLQNKLNLVFDKVNYKNELLHDFEMLNHYGKIPVSKNFSSSINSNKFAIVQYDDDDMQEVDADVEYNEDLDDADLLDDGEADYSDDDSEEESDDEAVDDYEAMEDVKIDVENEDEFGYSDVEDESSKKKKSKEELDEEEYDSEAEAVEQYDKKIKSLKKKLQRQRN